MSPVVVIPAELSESKTTVTIVDTLCTPYPDRRDQDKEDAIEVEMRKTDVILLLYDMSRLYSLTRISAFWLPWIYRVTKVPVILVGNKADMRTAGVPSSEETLSALIRDYPQCVFATECNVLTLANTDTVFYYAHYAVLYPSAPLYDSLRHELTPQFIRALLLCFRRLDRDKDRALNDRELNELQTQVFNQRFKDAELDSLKDLIKAESLDGVTAAGITFQGFVVLHKLLIKKLNGNVCWSLLRYFGFTDDLQLETDIQLDPQPSQSVELSNETVDFLVSLFEMYSLDGKMSPASLKEVFSTVESPLWAHGDVTEEAWEKVTERVGTDEEGKLTLAGWLALWYMSAYLDYQLTYTYLIMVGMDIPKMNVFLVTRPRDVAKANKRKVFMCCLCGDDDVGKNALLSSFISRPANLPELPLDSVCALVEGDRRVNETHYLIVRSIQLQLNSDFSLLSRTCDVAALLHDGSQTSIDYLKEEAIPRLAELTPKLIIRTKTDENEGESSDYSFAIDMGLTEYPAIAVRRSRPDSLFRQLVEIAVNPLKGLARAAKEQIKAEQYQNQISYGSWVLSAVAAAALLGVGILVRKG